ncbi:MAG TPA: agmatinase [Candidatus Hydrogenedentes bacterium]|nr:agmatinase [Candidatus Hydrogenedentota bacterium]HQM50480.1 agmatinase [Candidatus Hydrogenedentota bacterium]
MRHALPTSKNYLALDRSQSDIRTASVVVQQAPFERTSSYGTGSAKGPQAIIEASHQVELFDAALDREPVASLGGIATLAPMKPGQKDGRQFARTLKNETEYWIRQGKFVVTFGGEHTSTIGAIQAHCEAYGGLTVLQLDAHSDLRDEYEGSRWNHACAMARVLDFHKHLVQAGIRSQAIEERQKTDALGTPVVYAHQILAPPSGEDSWMKRVIGACRERVYITLDCDVFDPAVIPATGTPEPGGLNWAHVEGLFHRLCSAREVVGMDVTELAPIKGILYPQFTIARLVYRFLGIRFKHGTNS